MFLAILTTFTYAFSGITVGFANQVPNVQFDFKSGTTGVDLFHKNTLKFRSQCASNVRASGGFSFRKGPSSNEHDCWNQF